MSNGPSLVSVLSQKPVWFKYRDNMFYPALDHVRQWGLGVGVGLRVGVGLGLGWGGGWGLGWGWV